MQFILIHQSVEYSGDNPPLSMEGLQGRVIGITFRAAAVEAFRTLRIQRGLLLQARDQIRVGNIVATEGHGIDQAFTDQIVCLFHRVGASADNSAREAVAFPSKLVNYLLD